MSAVSSTEEVQPDVGTDERRMQVRAYNHWSSLLRGRDYPSIEDLVPEEISDFSPHAVLLNFANGVEDPATPFIGAAIRKECDLGPEGISTIAEVPRWSLLSRLTDHYLQIIANRAPVGFEAEFTNQSGQAISYRGILMPFSSDGAAIDYIYGVINWKVREAEVVPASPPPAVLVPRLCEHALEDDVLELVDTVAEQADEGLADRLQAARDGAEVCRAADGRSRAALYRALSLAYDFAIASRRVPEQYAEILEDAGIKPQARAPMTPIVKLVFGADYDKTRLTEFAAVLSHAQRVEVDFGSLEAFIEASDGGLKGIVAAERQARRPDKPAVDLLEKGRQALLEAAPVDLGPLPEEEELVLVLVRRSKVRGREDVGVIADQALLDRAIRQFAR